MAASPSYLLNDELLKLLECHICLKLMAPPIIQCGNGHNVRHNCRKHLDYCATCKSSFVEIRNPLAEDLALKLTYLCGNADVGCPVSVLGSELEFHERLCPFRIYGCLLKQEQSCTWTGRKKDILKHIKVDHIQFLIEQNVNKLKWSIKKDGDCKRIISVLGELFLFVRKFESNKPFGSFYVQFIGDDTTRSKFRYHIELKSSDKVHNISFSSMPISDLKIGKEIIHSEEFLMLSKGFCKILANEQEHVLYELKITSTEFCPSDNVKYSYDIAQDTKEVNGACSISD